MKHQETVEVVVVGAGPSGLSAALQLAREGVEVLVLERRGGPSDQPRAHVVNARTMELFRNWGIADAIRDAALPPELSRGFAWMSSMIGRELATLDYVDEATAERHSPERLCSCPQDIVEEVLATHVAAQPTATIVYGSTVTGVDMDDDGVRVQVQDNAGGDRTVEAAFVIGADGARSGIRAMADIGLSRSEPLGRRLNIYFRSDLAEHTQARPYILWFIMSEITQGIFIALDGATRWVYSIELESGEGPEAFPAERCAEIVRSAVGDPALELDVLSVLPWSVDMALATSFRADRIFLVGDAAHHFPPMGGFGMNSGIQDAHNLAWKLALVIRGEADSTLLDTYEPERRPVAETNANQSMDNARKQQQAAAMLAGPDILRLLRMPEGDELRAHFAAGVAQSRQEFHSQGQQFGYVYRSDAIIDDGSKAPVSTVANYRMTAAPGARAPHVRMVDADGRECSTIDLFAGGWTLLAAGAGWESAMASLAGTPVPRPRLLEVGRPGRHLADAGEPGQWQRVYGLEPGGAVLVRPDGHVAARWTSAPHDPAAALQQALATVVRPPAAVPSVSTA